MSAQADTWREAPEEGDSNRLNRYWLKACTDKTSMWEEMLLKPTYRAFILTIILAVAAWMRFTGLNWDEGQWIHPDEGHMRIITSAIEMPDSLALYFDSAHSPLNSRNRGYEYSYGTLPLFLTRMTAEWLDRGCGETVAGPGAALASLVAHTFFPADSCHPGSFTGTYSALVGRMFSALADLGTIVLLYLIGRTLYEERVGLCAAALGALTAFMIQQAHFFTVDSMACFFVTLTLYFSVRAGRSGNWLDFGLAGLSTGLAAACKIDGVMASLLVALAALWRWLESRQRFESLLRPGLRLALAGMLAFVAFRVAQPYAFQGPGFFGIRLSPEWLNRLEQIRAEQSGQVDMPWGRQWTNRTPILFSWVNMVVWGMGLPLGLAAWVGWGLAGYELLTTRGLPAGESQGRRNRLAHLVPWVWATLLFLYHSTRWVKAMRYVLPLYPIFILFAAYLLNRLYRAVPKYARVIGRSIAALVILGALLWAAAVFSIYLRPHTRVAASRWIYAHVPPGVTIANEHFDWGLPLRLDGHDPFGGMYQGFEMRHYDEDTPEKLIQLYEWLDQADYIITASNRLYASIPRLPARYPLTIEYYRALFAGELGFELVADFTSYPALGPFQFPDQETPFPLMKPTEYTYQTQPIQVKLPPAEEAFSVYDHPRVLIFRKTERYSRQLAEAVLGRVDLSHVAYGLNPRQADATPERLEFDPWTWAEQRAGGTWSEMFDRDSLLNTCPGLAVVLWWAVVAVIGWAAFPILFVALSRLRDRGYGMARILGLLIVAYLTWMAASTHVLPNTRSTIVRMLVFLILIGGGIAYLRRKELGRFLRHHRKLILLTEGLFAALYLFWVGVRMLHPDLWHTPMGGEKPMDFAYLNAVMKSTWFPPYNPWFSGAYINYYYYGFVIIGTLIKLTGTLPEIAYNLAVPLLFALTGVGAFSVAFNLFGGHRRGAIVAGLSALAFTVLLGNLGVVHLVRSALIALGGTPFPSTIPVFSETAAMISGIWKVVVHGASLSLSIESWYWHPTRIIPTWPGEVGPINEFPAFTFLYGDLHAHMIAFPITLFALALAVCWAQERRPGWVSILVGGLVIGALWPTNSWDYPTYLALALAALVLGRLSARGEGWSRVIAQAALLVALSRLLYEPYFRHYLAGYSSLERWRGSHTPFSIYLWMHGILLFPLLTRMVTSIWRMLCHRPPRASSPSWNSTIIGILAFAGVLALVAALLDYQVALAALPAGACAACLLFRPGTPAGRRLLWLMVGTAMALSLAVEIVVLKGDIGRMNTVFKFYLQVWMLLAVAAGVSLGWAYERTRRWSQDWHRLWWIGMGLLVLGGALFLPYGIRARAVDRLSKEAGITLDGMAFMRTSKIADGTPELREIELVGDYYAIRWMQDHIAGSPVIMEGLAGEYHWGNRVSVYTGLPAVIGWSWHQRQQRIMLPDPQVEKRRADVNACYNTGDVAYAWEILKHYGVSYIYVGEYERAFYDPAGLEKFDHMAAQGMLEVVYDKWGVRIYKVVSSWPA